MLCNKKCTWRPEMESMGVVSYLETFGEVMRKRIVVLLNAMQKACLNILNYNSI